MNYSKTLPVEPKIKGEAFEAPDLLDQIVSRLRMPKAWAKGGKALGEGTKRRRARERAMAAWRSGYYGDLPEPKVTRQQRRRSTILRGRQIMTVARKEAVQRGIKGGSAVIRNPVDVDRVLG